MCPFYYHTSKSHIHFTPSTSWTQSDSFSPKIPKWYLGVMIDICHIICHHDLQLINPLSSWSMHNKSIGQLQLFQFIMDLNWFRFDNRDVALSLIVWIWIQFNIFAHKRSKNLMYILREILLRNAVWFVSENKQSNLKQHACHLLFNTHMLWGLIVE